MPHKQQSLDFLDVFVPYSEWRLGKKPEPDLAVLMTKFRAFLESLGGSQNDERLEKFATEMKTMIESGNVKTR